MQTVIWIIIAVIVVAIIAAIVLSARRRRRQKLAERATELRTRAAQHDPAVTEERRRAEEAQAQAALARAEAERAEERAQEAQQSRAYEEARQEDALREADRLDPDVDHTATTGRRVDRSASVTGDDTIDESGTTTHRHRRQDI